MKKYHGKNGYYQLGITNSNIKEIQDFFSKEQKIYFCSLILSELYSDIDIYDNSISIDGYVLLKLINQIESNNYIINWRHYLPNISNIKQEIKQHKKYTFLIDFVYFEPYERFNKNGIFIDYDKGFFKKFMYFVLWIFYIMTNGYLFAHIILSIRNNLSIYDIVFQVIIFLCFLSLYFLEEYFLSIINHFNGIHNDNHFLLEKNNLLSKVFFDDDIVAFLHKEKKLLDDRKSKLSHEKIEIDLGDVKKVTITLRQKLKIKLLIDILKKENSKLFITKYI